jgi:shikimate kinase
MDGKTAKENIALIGFMGAGKSTIGNLLAPRLGMEYVDLDVLIEEREGKSIAEVFESRGESYFRELEKRVLGEQLSRKGKIISCGGGVVVDPDNTRRLRERSMVVYLRVSPESALERLREARDRPLLQVEDREERIRSLLREREPLYRAAAHLETDTDGKDPDVVVEEIIEAWKRYS